MRALLSKTASIALLLLAGVILGGSINNAAAQSAAAEVYAVCNNARLEISGTSEAHCGDLQDRYHIEFLCNERNASQTNHCWTEIK